MKHFGVFFFFFLILLYSVFVHVLCSSIKEKDFSWISTTFYESNTFCFEKC